MLDRKRDKDKPATQNILEAINAPYALANLTTGMDIFPIDIDKLIAAPEEWNFYSKLSDFKMEELISSIRTKGLLHPLVVWQQPDDTYIILSGHNRKFAIQYLLEEYKAYFPEQFEENKLLEVTDEKKKPVFNFEFIATLVQTKKIHCYIKKYNEINEEIAKEIIIDTNWVQRALTTSEKSRSILYKYTLLGRKKRTTNGESLNELYRDTIAAQLDISGRQVSKYIRLNYLIPVFAEFLNDNLISINSGVKLSQFSDEMQSWIFDNYSKVLCNKNIQHLKKDMTKAEITQVLLGVNSTEEVTISTVPEISDTLFDKYVETLPINEIVMNTIQIPIDIQPIFKIAMLKFFKDNNM